MARRKRSSLERNYIQERANNCCEYCKFPYEFSHGAFHIEHIIPLAKQGSEELDNLAFSCDGCNSLKRAHTEWIDPETNLFARLFNPRKQIWNEHFGWEPDSITINGKTPTGRATVDLLNLNRPGLINVRKAIIALGILPKDW